MLKGEITRMWGMKKVIVIPLVAGVLGAISTGFQKYVAAIGIKMKVEQAQKTALCGTARTLRLVLGCLKKNKKNSIIIIIIAWQLVTDLIGIFNADSRKNVSKFSGLRWFFVFEDLYNGEGSLQANKTSKKQNLNLKQ